MKMHITISKQINYLLIMVSSQDLPKEKTCISLLASIVFSYHYSFILMSGKMNQIGIAN